MYNIKYRFASGLYEFLCTIRDRICYQKQLIALAKKTDILQAHGIMLI